MIQKGFTAIMAALMNIADATNPLVEWMEIASPSHHINGNISGRNLKR